MLVQYGHNFRLFPYVFFLLFIFSEGEVQYRQGWIVYRWAGSMVYFVV